MEKLSVNLHPNLSAAVLKKLSQNQRNTIADFLQEEVEKLSNISKLDIASILEVRDRIFKQYAASLIEGTTLLEKYLIEDRFLKTGIKGLDSILNGGIPIGFLSEICGLAGSGKSQLCMQLAINCAMSSNSSVLYIDTKQDFSAVRIQKTLEAYGLSHKDMALIMLKINIVQIFSMKELIKLFENIKNKKTVFNNLCLIILDSLPCLIFQHFGDDNKIGLKYLNIFVNLARYISKEFRISIVCVNIETRWVDQEQVPDLEDEDNNYSYSHFGEPAYFEKKNRCLGKYWRSIPALVLRLEKNLGSDTEYCLSIKVIAENCNNPCSELQCCLSITHLGVT